MAMINRLRPKTFFQVITVVMLASHFCQAQQPDVMLQKLIEVKLIRKKQVRAFEEQLEALESRSHASYLYALLQLEFKKVHGEYYAPYTFYTVLNGETSKQEAEKINQQLMEYLGKLNTCGLITEKQSDTFQAKIESGKYISLLQLLPEVANRSAYDEWLMPEKIIAFGEKLLANDIVTPASFATLREDAAAHKIVSHHQLLDYCRHARFFDLGKYSNDPAIYLEKIHKEVAAIFPELAFTDFRYAIEVDSSSLSSDYTSHQVVVSLKTNGRLYKHASFISPDDIGKDGNYLGKLDHQQFYQIFNKVLADLHAPFRLHAVQSRHFSDEGNKYQYFGIIGLAEQQTEMFRISDSYIELSYEVFNALATDRIDSAIHSYKSPGLFDHLTPAQIERGKEKVTEQLNTSFNRVLSCFPDVIYSFDIEMDNPDDPYAQLLNRYATISHQAFNVSHAADDFDLEKNNAVRVSFNLGPKYYEKVLKIDDDWIDDEFFNFVKGVVSENKLGGQFYQLYAEDQGSGVIYLTPQQETYLRAHKLLEFSDEFEN